MAAQLNDRDKLLAELFDNFETFKCVFLYDYEVMAIRIPECLGMNDRINIYLYSYPCTTIYIENGQQNKVWFKYEWWFDFDGNFISNMDNAKKREED